METGEPCFEGFVALIVAGEDVAEAEPDEELLIGVFAECEETVGGGDGGVEEAFIDLEFHDVLDEPVVVRVGGGEIVPCGEGVVGAAGACEETAEGLAGAEGVGARGGEQTGFGETGDGGVVVAETGFGGGAGGPCGGAGGVFFGGAAEGGEGGIVVAFAGEEEA